MSEIIGRDGELTARSGEQCNYILVSWDDSDGKPRQIGWVKVSDSLLNVPDGDNQANTNSSGVPKLSWTVRDGEIKHGELCCWVQDSKMIRHDDSEPMFGLTAVLDDLDFEAVSKKTRSWLVETVSFAEVAFITRAKLLQLFQEHWPATCSGDEVAENLSQHSTDLRYKRKEPALHASTSSMVGGQRAIGQLVLMDHNMTDAAYGWLRKLPSDNISPLTSAQHNAQQLHSRERVAVQSFEDCSKRFDTIEAQLTDVLATQKQVLQAVSSLQARFP